MSRRNILVVEDDAAIRRGIADALAFAGHRVVESPDGAGVLACLENEPIDLVLLDVRLPRRDGFEILRELRMARPRLPVIMVTARGAEDDRVQGLQLGADDYVVKPFSARELLARVEAVLRRSVPDAGAVARIRLGDRSVDLDRLQLTLPDGSTVALSERETSILRHLAVHRGRPVRRSELLEWVWGYRPRHLVTRTVDMHIARLRGKLEDDPANPRFVLTVRSRGYMLADTEDDA